MKDKKSSSRPIPWLPIITGLSLALLIFIASTRGGPSPLPAAETSAPPPRAASAHTQRSEAPPPRPGEEVLAFNARQGRWQPAPLNDLKPGAEFIHKGRLFRIDPRLETLRRIREVDIHRLKAADANWDPTAKHRFPRVKDVVYVTKGDPRHTLLSHVRVGEELSFQGRIYKAKVRGKSLAIEATDQVLTEVTNTFKRPAHTLVDLDIAYLNSGASQRISGTPEHPFFVPAVDDYVPMGQLSPGTILRTEDGKQARVVGSKRRHGDFTVFNLEVAHAHNYFVSAPGSAAPGVLVHNTCKFKPKFSSEGIENGIRETTLNGRHYEVNSVHAWDQPHDSGIYPSRTGISMDTLESALVRDLDTFISSGGRVPNHSTSPLVRSLYVNGVSFGYRPFMLPSGRVRIVTYWVNP